MVGILQSIFSSWSIDPAILVSISGVGIIYLRGWRIFTRTAHKHFPVWRLWAFFGGLLAFWVAIASPLNALSGLLLSAHMVQHLLLLTVSPPLILLGSPLLPVLRGLPRSFAHDGIGPFLNWSMLREIGTVLTHPLVCWMAMAATLCLWHIPTAFELALRSPGWHKAEHISFFSAALFFWWPVVRPYPTRFRWPLWILPLYLLAADMLNTALSAILTFSEHILYPSYENGPRLFGLTALADQGTAGLIMWVPGSLCFLVPAVALAIQFLSPAQSLVRPTVPLEKLRPLASGNLDALKQQSIPASPFNMLAVPFLGSFLKSRFGRRILQGLLLAISIAVIADGIFGPQIASLNLAGVLPWTCWRAFTVVGLLAIGNVFCMACPFMLPREAGRHLGLSPRSWPRLLRSKWLAIALLILFFWAYEVFGLWDHPLWTAGIILGYFFAAFVVDAFFRGAAFCKFVCPIGQFHFVNSLVSPLEVKVLAPDVCSSCVTHDCLRGNAKQRGCEMNLYLPQKVGNLDCTFCLDCVRACPHENVGLLFGPPGGDLVRDPIRSSVGQLSRRRDVAALGLVVAFAAFLGAALMTAPVADMRDRVVNRFGPASAVPITTAIFLTTLVFVPPTLIFSSVLLGRTLSRLAVSLSEISCRLALALTPLGLTMWVAHFLFHLETGWVSVGPAIIRAWSASWIHSPRAFDRLSSSMTSGWGLLNFQILLLDVGLLVTLYVGWRIARHYAPNVGLSFKLICPWSVVALALYCSGVWIFLQPMQMRGV